MDVSVVIPTFNRDDTVERCLKAIRTSRVMRQVEIVVVDTGSTDRTVEVARRFADLLVSSPRRNTALARNKGASVASNEILMFIDSDVFVEPDAIEYLAQAVERYPHAMVGARILWYGGEIHGQQQKPEAKLRHVKHEGTIFIESIYGCIQVTHRDTFNRVGQYDRYFARYAQDFDLCVRYWGNGFPLIYEPRAEAYHAHERKVANTTEYDGRQFNMLKAIYLLPYKYELATRSSLSLDDLQSVFAGVNQAKLAKEVDDFLAWLISFQRSEERQQRKHKVALPYGFTQDLFSNPETVLDLVQRGGANVRA